MKEIILKKQDGCQLDLSDLGQSPMAGSYKHSTEPQSCIKGQGVSLLAEKLLASQVWLCFMKFILLKSSFLFNLTILSFLIAYF
jgi:hypothetical protein